MGKNHKHMKQLKSEKAKVKLKAKKSTKLPKGLNVTDTSFKVKKIIITEQLKQHADSEILSKRKLNVKDLLSRLQHHNSTVRQDAVKELKNILHHYSPELLSEKLMPLLQGVSLLSLDKEKAIRRDAFKVLHLILSPLSKEQLNPFSGIIISYLKCAMTHIDQNIKEDSLLFFDLLASTCSGTLAENSCKILPIFLDMISKLHTDTRPGRQLSTVLNSKNTTTKWRIQVLGRLNDIFKSIVNYRKSKNINHSNSHTRTVIVGQTKYIPIRKPNNDIWIRDPTITDCETKEISENFLEAEDIFKYVNILLPLMFDSWIEVCPTEKLSNNGGLLSSESAILLNNIVEIIQSIIDCLDLLCEEGNKDIKTWFQNNFEMPYTKNICSKFPYSKINTVERIKKRQEDFSYNSSNCYLNVNLAICHIYVWFTSTYTNIVMNKNQQNLCSKILEYVNDKIANWSDNDNSTIPQLTKLIKTLFLKASQTWYKNNLNLSSTLSLIINSCCKQSKKEMNLQMFAVLSDIISDNTLTHLHNEPVFKDFIVILPNILLQPSIHETTIYMIHKVVIRYRDWIKKELLAKQNEIIENSKRIQIIGSENEKNSRLFICNLFYFFDGQIYF